MKTGLVIAGAIFGLFLLFAVGGVMGYISWSNDALAYEADIPAQYSEMKNVYDNGWKDVMEEAQVPQNMADDMKSVWQAALTGRYGANGSQAVLQFIKEQNPQLDPAIYRKVQERIEAFHATFAGAQTSIIAKKQSYQKYLFATTSGRFYNMVGNYPHIHCGVPAGADDYAILTSDKTETDFKRHKADALDLRQKKN